MLQKVLLPTVLLVGSTSALHLGSAAEASAQLQLQMRLQELVEDEQLIDISQFNKEEEFNMLLETDRDCEETGWKSYLQVGQQVHQTSYSMSTTEESQAAREKRESEIKQSAKRAEQILQDRLSQTYVLAATDGKTDTSAEFKEQMHNQINKLNTILDEIDSEAQHYSKKLYLQESKAEANATLEVKSKRVLHIVPHSHTDDLSSNKEIQKLLSQQTGDSDLYQKGSPTGFIGTFEDILNSTMLELYADGNKTFTFGDIKFFKQWYDKLNQTDKEDVKTVIQNGQLDLVNGAWMPPDEALTQFDSLLDSFQVGQQFLWKEFEYQPRVSWQLDVNGVSQGYARLAKDVGFDMLIFSSVSPAEKEKMRKEGTHTQIWRTSQKNFGKRKDVLAVTLDQGQNALNSYCWPKGFWADSNYLIDSPIVLNKTQSDYKFDELVKSLYADVSDRFDQDNKTQQLFQPFGCDMAFVDAKINFKIMDKLMVMWKELGFDKDVEIKYSTPTIFYQHMQTQNSKFIAAAQLDSNSTANASSNDTKNGTENGWTIRKDDSFPYQPSQKTYMNGYYSARPHLKKKVREFTQTFHSSLRLLSQQVLRKDTDENKTAEVLQFQSGILESLGNLQSFEAITGTSNQLLSGEYYSNAKTGKREVMEMNQKFLAEKIYSDFGIKVKKLDSDMNFNFDNDDLSSPYSHNNKTLVVVQNPSQQKREQIVEIQVPYYNFTIEQVVNNKSELRSVKVEKYLPRVWQNSQKFVVPSLAQFKVKFDNPFELYKVFIITGKGVVKSKNPVPENYQFKFQSEPKIWNLNLPVFLPKNGWEINNFQQNFQTLLPNTTIVSGSKSLKFIEIVPKKKAKKATKGSKKGEKSEGASTKGKEDEDDSLQKQAVGEKGSKGSVEPKPQDSANSTAELDPIAEAQNATSNMSQANSTSDSSSSKKMKRGKKTAVKPLSDENEGAAVFLYEDKAKGIKQKFAFSLRYYVGEHAIGDPLQKTNSTGLVQLDKRLESGVFSFQSKDGSVPTAQKSFRYGEVNLKRSKKKVANSSAEFLLVYEQKYAPPSAAENNATNPKGKIKKPEDKFKTEEYSQKIRAHVRINLNKIEDFVQFHVSTNEIPVNLDKTGKDIVVDWFLMDGFDTNETFWVDANGLQMVPKSLNTRKEFNIKNENTVSGNYYPITSAIAVRDFNKTMNTDRQVTVMTDRSQGASAGMRSRKNIEIMHQRRYRKSNSSKSAEDGLNDLDGKGRGLQVKETYYMQVTTTGKSQQRALQRAIDQPMLIHYSQGYAAPTKVNSGGKFMQGGAGGEKDDDAAGASGALGSGAASLKLELDVMTNITESIIENQKEAKEAGLNTTEQRNEKLVKKAVEKQAERAKSAEQKEMKAKGQTDDDFKGRSVDHKNKDIPDKIVNHYPEGQQGKTADQASQPGQKAKKKDKPKQTEPVDEPLAEATLANKEAPAPAQDAPAQNSFIQIQEPNDKTQKKGDKQNQTLVDPNQKQLDVDKSTYSKDEKIWFNKFNKEFKESSTVKLLTYGVQKNQIMIRLTNLEDQFDGLTAKSYKFDINAWAREFYLESNMHYLAQGNTTADILQGIRLNITEMNLAGSIPKSYFLNKTQAHTKWLQQGTSFENLDGPTNGDVNVTSLIQKSEKEPIDNVQMAEIDRAKGSLESLGALFEPNFIVTLEPQSIRMFSIQYFMPNLNA